MQGAWKWQWKSLVSRGLGHRLSTALKAQWGLRRLDDSHAEEAILHRIESPMGIETDTLLALSGLAPPPH